MNESEVLKQSPADSRQSDASGPAAGAAPFVWSVWAGMLLLALSYVGHFGVRSPVFDDWALVPVLTGSQPLTPTWLWAQHNEHRVPLPKLVLYALGKLSGFDFRAGMFFNVALMGGFSFLLLLAIRRVRGHLHFADAFLPLLVLGLTQWESFLIEFALNLVGSTVVAGTFLLLLAGGGPQVSARRAVGMGACLAVLPLMGGSGLALVPALALWLAFVGVLHCRAADAASRRLGWLVLGLIAAALLLAGLYSIGFQHSSKGAPSCKPSAVLECGLEVLSMLFGHTEVMWRYRAWLVPVVLLCAGVVWGAAWRRPREPVVQLGFLAFLLGMGCLVGAVAWGRADFGWGVGFAPRYATLMIPLGCCLYFLWERYGSAPGARTAQTVLFLLAAMAFLPNLKEALAGGHARQIAGADFAAALASRIPPGLLAERDAGRTYPASDQGYLAYCLRLLRDARVGDFRSLPEDLPLRAVALPRSAASPRDMVWVDDAARPVGDNPALAFTFPPAKLVYAVRLHYVYTNGAGRADRFEVSWHKDGGDTAAGVHDTEVVLENGPGEDGKERTATVWVNERIDAFRLIPNTKFFSLRLSAVELLLPENGGLDAVSEGEGR